MMQLTHQDLLRAITIWQIGQSEPEKPTTPKQPSTPPIDNPRPEIPTEPHPHIDEPPHDTPPQQAPDVQEPPYNKPPGEQMSYHFI